MFLPGRFHLWLNDIHWQEGKVRIRVSKHDCGGLRFMEAGSKNIKVGISSVLAFHLKQADNIADSITRGNVLFVDP